MVVRRYGVLTEVEQWGSAAVGDCPADIVHAIHQDATAAGAVTMDAFTLVIDLGLSCDAIRAAFTKDTRTEINRAEATDRLTWQVNDRAGDDFFSDYRAFVRHKNIHLAGEQVFERYRDAGMLIVTSVHNSDGRPINWHSYITGGRSIILLQSFSGAAGGETTGAQRGRANRFHHWRDMVHFQAGFEEYDFGGWYPYLESPALLNVNRFKEEFGGALVRKINVRRPVTWRGRIAVWLLAASTRMAAGRRPLAERARALKMAVA